MNDEDLRDFFAGLALMGLVASNKYIQPKDLSIGAFLIADAMIEAKYYEEPEPVPEEGITAIKPKRKPRSTT